ncbi:MAG: hypothetical protein PHS56_10530 [Eubacteriales bacterium]|jgi:hypothetical protein|nr:hypothetical protein [Eubacteriales bacterium]MDD3074843.1 hypothetical protein [Eubacteriales bacterium]
MSKIAFENNQKKTLTEEEMKAIKAAEDYDYITVLEVKGKQCFLHPPTRQILDAANSASKKAESKFNEVLMKGCWLAGDKEMVTDDRYFIPASAKLGELIDFGEATVKKY